MNKTNSCGSLFPYKGLTPFQEKDRLFFFGRKPECQTIIKNLETWRLTVLYGDSGVGKSSILRAGVLNELNQDAQRNLDKYGYPSHIGIVFPPLSDKSNTEKEKQDSWQGPLQGIKKQIKSAVENLGIKKTVEDENDDKSLTETLKAWTNIILGEYGRGKLYIILDQFEEYFSYLRSSKTNENLLKKFAKELVEAINDKDLNANFMISLKKSSLAELDYFKKDLQDLLFKHRLELKPLDQVSAYEAIEKPMYEYNRYSIIRHNLETHPVTILCGNTDTHKSVLLREGVYQCIKQDAEQNQKENGKPEIAAVVFSSWYDNTLEKLVDKIQTEIKNLGIDNIPAMETSLVETLQKFTGVLSNKEGEGRLFLIFDQFEEYFWNKNERNILFESLVNVKANLKPKLFTYLLARVSELCLGSFLPLHDCLCNCQDQPIIQLLDAIKHNKLKNVNILMSIRENWYPAIPVEFEEQISWESYLYLFNQQRDLSDGNKICIPVIKKLPIEVKTTEQEEVKTTEQEINMEEGLSKDIVEGEKGIKSEGKINSPYLQLVMERLWQKDYDSRLLKKDTYRKLGRAEGIALAHVEQKIEQLELEKKRAVAYLFSDLITPSGIKITYPADDLFTNYKNFREPVFQNKLKIKLLEKTVFEKLLSELTQNEYRLLSDELTKDKENQDQKIYKIYHDVLIQPILSWKEKFIKDEEAQYLKILDDEAQKLRKAEERNERKDSVDKILREWIPKFTNDEIRQEELISLLLQQAYKFDKEYKLDKLVEIDRRLREALSCDNFSSILHFSEGEGKDISSLAVSKDNWLATGSYDGTIRLWNLSQRGSDPTPLQYNDETKIITSIAFSQDGKILAVGREDGTVQLWKQDNAGSAWSSFKPFEAHTGVGKIKIDGQADKQPEVRAIAFSPIKENLIATGSWDSNVCLWDLNNLALPLVTLPHDDWIWSIAFSPDGQTLAAGCRNGTVSLWKLDTTNLTKIKDMVLHEDKDWRKRNNEYQWDRAVLAVAFHPQDSNILATGSWDGKVRVWRLSNLSPDPEIFASASEILAGQNEMQVDEDAVKSLAFSPDGQLLIAGRENQEIWMWQSDILEAQPIKLEKGHTLGISSLAFTPDGQKFVSGGWDSRIRLWDLHSPTAKPIVLKTHENRVTTVAFSPQDRMLLASGSYDQKTLLWELSNPKTKPTLLRDHEEGNVNSVAFSADGAIVASGNYSGNVRLWKLDNPDQVFMTLSDHGEEVSSVAFNPLDSKILASGTYNCTILLWDVSNPNQPIKTVLKGHKDRVNSVAFSPDGKILASGDSNHIVRLWWTRQLPNASFIEMPRFEGRISSITFSPKLFNELQILAVATNKERIELWDVSPMQKNPDAEPIFLRQYSFLKDLKGICVAFSPDGLFLASGSNDCKVRLWDLQQPKANPIVLEGSTKPIITLAFSLDGEWIAAGSEDKKIWIWIAKTKTIADMVCQKVWRNLTDQQWKEFVGKNIPRDNISSNKCAAQLRENKLLPKQKKIFQAIKKASASKQRLDVSEEEIAEQLKKIKLDLLESNTLESLCCAGFVIKIDSDSQNIKYCLSCT